MVRELSSEEKTGSGLGILKPFFDFLPDIRDSCIVGKKKMVLIESLGEDQIPKKTAVGHLATHARPTLEERIESAPNSLLCHTWPFHCISGM